MRRTSEVCRQDVECGMDGILSMAMVIGQFLFVGQATGVSMENLGCRGMMLVRERCKHGKAGRSLTCRYVGYVIGAGTTSNTSSPFSRPASPRQRMGNHDLATFRNSSIDD